MPITTKLKLWVWILLMVRWGVLDATLCDKVCQWLASGQWFFKGTLVSSTNKTDYHDITEILLNVALNSITLTLFNSVKTVTIHIFGILSNQIAMELSRASFSWCSLSTTVSPLKVKSSSALSNKTLICVLSVMLDSLSCSFTLICF